MESTASQPRITPDESEPQPGSTIDSTLRADLTVPPIHGVGIPAHARHVVNDDAWLVMATTANQGGPWPLVLVGPAGTGKTCAALCLLDYVRVRQYLTVPDMIDTLVAVQHGLREYGTSRDTPPWWWGRYRTAECVVLDEIGARDRVSDFHYECVKRAIDERVGRPAVFVTNQKISDIERVYDDRIASRLAGGTVIRFGGEDRRLLAADIERNHDDGTDGQGENRVGD